MDYSAPSRGRVCIVAIIEIIEEVWFGGGAEKVSKVRQPGIVAVSDAYRNDQSEGPLEYAPSVEVMLIIGNRISGSS